MDCSSNVSAADEQITVWSVILAKCEFARATVVYLGNLVGQGQVRPVGTKIKAIDKYPVPKTKKELRRSWGLVGY